MEPEQPPYANIWAAIKEGLVVPVLGPTASARGRDMLKNLARDFTFPEEQYANLAQVAQYVTESSGRDALRRWLYTTFGSVDAYEPVHELLASVQQPMLIISLNYDDMLEQAFWAKDHPFDLIVYAPNRKDESWLGSVLYWKYGVEHPTVIVPNKFRVDLSRTTLIYKIHGSIDRINQLSDKYVIDELDAAYLFKQMGTGKILPAGFGEHFIGRHFLHLEYNLRDWNYRILLSLIERMNVTRAWAPSWAFQSHVTPIEQFFWQQRRTRAFALELEEFVRCMQQQREQNP